MPDRKGPRKPQKNVVPVKLDDSLAARIAALSEKMGEGKSVVMRIAMRIGLRSLEEAHRVKPINPADYKSAPQGGYELNETKGEKP